MDDFTDSNREFLNDDEELSPDYGNQDYYDAISEDEDEEDANNLFDNLIAELQEEEGEEEDEEEEVTYEYEAEDEDMDDMEQQAIFLYRNYLLFASVPGRYQRFSRNELDDDENDSALQSNSPSKRMGAELLKSGNFGIVESLYRDEMSGRRAKQEKEQCSLKREAEDVGDAMDTSTGEPQNKEKSAPQQANSKDKILHPKSNITRKILDRELDGASRTRVPMGIAKRCIPNSNGEIVEKYPARAYSGQFSQDGSFFYTCCQDFNVYIYDTGNPNHFIKKKKIKGQAGGWTITDASLSPDNEWIVYSSISPVVYLAKTSPYEDYETPLDFHTHHGIFSVRFSGDGRELVAGGRIDSRHDKCIYVYDIESRKVVLAAGGHDDDVNAVCFVDESSNVLLSGSDDSFIKVWDRRSMRGERPSGILLGHTEGITFVSSKGDGRYCISNGKDQKMKLWDIRMMFSQDDFSKLDRVDYRQREWDYRHNASPRSINHPQDCSVQTYTGHKVLRTLIRCHFSPVYSTGQQYVYSGSSDGRIHVYSLDGTAVKVLETQNVTKIPSRTYRNQYIVRDVSWHPYLPVLISTCWTGDSNWMGEGGGMAVKHEYKAE